MTTSMLPFAILNRTQEAQVNKATITATTNENDDNGVVDLRLFIHRSVRLPSGLVAVLEMMRVRKSF